LKKSIKDVVVYSIVSAISGAISFLLLPVLTKYLSPSDYGLLAIFNALIRFLALIIPFGMTHLLLVDLSRDKLKFKNSLSSFIKSTFYTALILTAVLFIVSQFSGEFFGLNYAYLFFIPIIALLVVYFELFTSILVFLQEVKRFTLFNLGKYGVETSLTISFIVFLNQGWFGRILALIISILLTLPFFIRFLKNNSLLPKLDQIRNPTNTKELLKKGSPLILMSVSILLINLSDRFFIEKMIGIDETGRYSVASSIAALMLMLIAALMKVVRPKLYQKLNEAILDRKFIRKTTLLYHLLLLIIAISLIIILPFIYSKLVNDQFINSINYCWILIVSLFFWGGYSYFISFSLHSGNNKANGIISTLAIILNLILNAILIEQYGTPGAAYATVVTYIFMFLSSVLIFLFLNESVLRKNN